MFWVSALPFSALPPSQACIISIILSSQLSVCSDSFCYNWIILPRNMFSWAQGNCTMFQHVEDKWTDGICTANPCSGARLPAPLSQSGGQWASNHGSHTGPASRRGPPVAQCFAVAVLKLLIILTLNLRFVCCYCGWFYLKKKKSKRKWFGNFEKRCNHLKDLGRGVGVKGTGNGLGQ